MNTISVTSVWMPGNWRLRLLMHILPEELKLQTGYQFDAAFDWQAELKTFVLQAQRREFGPSTGSLVKAAEERDIPWLRLNNASLVQFGHGKYQQRIQATITSQTKHIAVEISCDKEDTHNMLNDLGLPVPQQRMVYSKRRGGAGGKAAGLSGRGQAAGRQPRARRVDQPDRGRADRDGIRRGARAQRTAGRFWSRVSSVGFDHRMLVVDGHLVAVAKRVPGHVVGDGKSTDCRADRRW